MTEMAKCSPSVKQGLVSPGSCVSIKDPPHPRNGYLDYW
jgi:hypothetical protein